MCTQGIGLLLDPVIRTHGQGNISHATFSRWVQILGKWYSILIQFLQIILLPIYVYRVFKTQLEKLSVLLPWISNHKHWKLKEKKKKRFPVLLHSCLLRSDGLAVIWNTDITMTAFLFLFILNSPKISSVHTVSEQCYWSHGCLDVTCDFLTDLNC